MLKIALGANNFRFSADLTISARIKTTCLIEKKMQDFEGFSDDAKRLSIYPKINLKGFTKPKKVNSRSHVINNTY